MKLKNIIMTIDSHTEGQSTRLVTGGLPYIPGKTMEEKKVYVKQNLDHIRRAILHEPRGAMSSFGCIMTPPVTEKTAFGIIWMERGEDKEKRYVNMCGHGTIGLAVTAVEMGMVERKEPVTEVSFDTPAGIVNAMVNIKDNKIQNVTIQNVPVFFYGTEVIRVPELGDLKVDIAFGGNNFAIVNAKDLGIGTSADDIRGARELFQRVLESANNQVKIQHPEKTYISGILGLLISGKPIHPEATVKNIEADEVGNIDRSPCGTGTSARMAAKYAKGELKLGEDLITESVTGSMFRGKLIKETTVAGKKAVVPQITGRAFITGIHQFMIDDDDPFKYGFLL